MNGRAKSDGLGGFFGVSLSLWLGAHKNLTCKNVLVMILPLFFMLHSNQMMYSVYLLSFILALQRSNETYKYIRQPFRYIQPPSNNNSTFTSKCIYTLICMVFFLWLLSLLLVCGDIHPNPGPDSVSLSSNQSMNSSQSSFSTLSNHLSIMHLNIQSLLPKIDIIRCEAQAYDVLVFSESWLKPEISNDSILIENFSPPHRTDRCNRPGGGVIIFVRDSFFCKRRNDLELRELEAVWVEIHVKSKHILIGGFYRPPNSKTDYFNLVAESIDRAYNTNIDDIIVTGDFNYDMLTNDKNIMADLINQYSLKLVIDEATHFTENSSSLIDLILVRNNANILISGVADPFIPDQIRYHCPVILLLKYLRSTPKTYKRKIWNYGRADFNRYRELLSEIDFEGYLETNNDIEESLNFISESISDASEKTIPHKLVTIRPNVHPWITCNIRKLIRKRKRVYRRYKRTSSIFYLEKYKKLRNMIVSKIRIAKKQYFDNLEHVLSTEDLNSRLFWKTSKQILNLRKYSKIPTLELNGEVADDDLEKANMLNNYFSSQTLVNDTNKQLPIPNLPIYNNLDSIDITVQEVSDILVNLNVNKAHGPDHLSPYLLKEGALLLARPLSILFNRSLQQGHFPSTWKDASITPIYKKDAKSSPSNYRPISLLDPLGKVMERCIHKHIYNYISENRLLTPFQSGFIPNDSTTYQLLHTYHTFCEAVDSGKEVRAVFCDVSKAFDRVWHRGLLYKLSCFGFSDLILNWFSSYLSGRRQRVILSGSVSEWMLVNAGVPQGSILGPLLFLIFINDIVCDINSSIRLFADDTSLYIIVENPQNAAIVLNSDLDTISKWASNWLVDFNPSKTCSLLISRKSVPIAHPSLIMNNFVLTESSHHKHLGVIFSSTCNWNEHIEKITESAWIRLNLLRALKFKISRLALEKIYITFIRPLLEYSDVVWDNCTAECKLLLDSVHHEAARIVTGATKLCSIEKLLGDLGWETLQERRTKHKLVVLYKIINGLAPEYLANLVPPLVRENNPYNLRNSDDIQPTHARTNLFFNSFFPSTVRAWNNLADDVKNASTVAAFKYRLNRGRYIPPKFFDTGSRMGQILHARLRMECSSLNSHLYRKNIVDSPSCACGDFESSYHYLFICPKYANIRHTYLSSYLRTHNTHELLFGKENVSLHENEDMVLKVQEYIIKSRRFI